MEMNNTPVDRIPNMNGGIRPPWVVEEADPLVSTTGYQILWLVTCKLVFVLIDLSVILLDIVD
jgi:hypothetical protein